MSDRKLDVARLAKSFSIAMLTRYDLEESGFDTSDISDTRMQSIADDLGERYTGNIFWSDLIEVCHEWEVPEYPEPEPTIIYLKE